MTIECEIKIRKYIFPYDNRYTMTHTKTHVFICIQQNEIHQITKDTFNYNHENFNNIITDCEIYCTFVSANLYW